MQPNRKINVAILDDHQSIVDGYVHRLSQSPLIEVVATLNFGDQLEPALAKFPTDVLLLDISVPVSAKNSNDYPILYVIPKLMQLYPHMNILVISMFAERGLIRGIMDAGANGYILKDDRSTLVDLANVVLTIAGGGIHLSQKAHQLFLSDQLNRTGNTLSLRQLEALSLCAAFPDALTTELSKEMAVANSTFRNLLSGAYIKLNVRTRTAAISKARSLGIITPFAPPTPSAD
ncbi:response regulator transcription factor [Candidatus Villigracilis saccharophilus]|uniref:response regulator transcription factor n=1 Tax=Candidatus Villigracilis saccharophilus TaxID=3140684 RepID=UPI003136AEB1|nr:response regulator transcription factor [Anaerolineales bacterium]